MFGISFEHIIILAIILLIFGPKRLPELGNTMGKAMKNFKDSLNGVEEAKYRKLPDETPNSSGTETKTAGSADPVKPSGNSDKA